MTRVVHRLFLVAFACAIVLLASAASQKQVVEHIKCAVCKQAMKEASRHAKMQGVDDEDVLVDLVERLCNGGKDEGKWTTRIDIFKRDSSNGAQLALDHRDEEGNCREECKAVQSACHAALKSGRDQTLVSLLKDDAGVGRLQREVCQKPCAKHPSALGDWKDEHFESAKPAMPPPPEPKKEEPSAVDHIQAFTKVFSDVLYGVFSTLSSDKSPSVDALRNCYKSGASGATSQFLRDFKEASQDMMAKKLDAMRAGLVRLGGAVAGLADAVQATCTEAFENQHAAETTPSPGLPSVMKAMGQQLSDLAERSSIQYEPMKSLRLNDRDLHKPLNSMLVTWTEASDGIKLGRALVKVLEAPHKVGGGSSTKEKEKTEL